MAENGYFNKLNGIQVNIDNLYPSLQHDFYIPIAISMSSTPLNKVVIAN